MEINVERFVAVHLYRGPEGWVVWDYDTGLPVDQPYQTEALVKAAVDRRNGIRSEVADCGYMAVLIAPDGEWVTDFRRETVQAVWDCVNDMGSRWIFYPLVVVVKAYTDGGLDDQTDVVSYPDGVIGPDVLADLLADVRAGDLQALFELNGS